MVQLVDGNVIEPFVLFLFFLNWFELLKWIKFCVHKFDEVFFTFETFPGHVVQVAHEVTSFLAPYEVS
jgi:hypothetical protein